MATATLLDIAKLNGNDKVVGLIEENLRYAPEVTRFPMRVIRGTSYKTVTRTAFPNSGFRAANDGHTPTKSTFANKQVECYIFGGVIQVDKAVAMAYEEGPAAWEMIESSGMVKQAMLNLGSQIWYGTSADSSGFAGIKAAVAKGSTLAIDATGTTATTASSVYAVKFGVQDVTMVAGQNGAISLSEFKDQQITGVNSQPMPGRVADLTAWLGLQIGNVNCVGRILNLTEDSGKGLTDTLIAKLLAKFPVGFQPDAFFMSRRSARQLQVSRTIVINSGPGSAKAAGSVESVAPWPTSAFNIPIEITDSILDTDTIE